MSTAISRRTPQAARLFAALGDPSRLHLISRLSGQGPLSITRLTDGTPLTRQAITKHLRVLVAAGFVHSVRQGRESVWEVETKRIAEARKYLDSISQQWDAALDRLRAFVEG